MSNKLMEQIRSTVPDLKEFGNYQVEYGDDFSYTDPVTNSVNEARHSD